jgi:short subunit dehydrogenase-like uncharacterized protein
MNAATQKGPIAVYGATGFTGKLVAHELRRRGADLVIAGRSGEKLAALSSELGGVPTVTAAVDDPVALRDLLDPCAAVIACAGPFVLHGEPVLEAAVQTATHYLDTTGEQPFIRMVFDRYGEQAAENGTALVSGMGFDYVPGDMIAALVAAGMEPVDEVAVAYRVGGFGPTRGTALSALQILDGDAVEWRDSEWHPAGRRVDGGTFRFPQPVGEKRTVRYPAGEQITVPRHIETALVRTMLSGMALPPPPLATLAVPAIGLAMRTPIRHIAEAAIRRMPEGPSEEDRRGAKFMVGCEVRAGSRVRRGSVTGSDVYGLTAVTTAHGALLAADPAYERSGALAPAQAFDPQDFLAALADFGVAFELEPLPEPAAV